MKLEDYKIKNFQEFMIEWYKENGRDFPWRHSEDPYRILVSEFLLQKTHVRKVEEIYIKFLENYPNIKSLSNAELSSIENLIKPLGFINRAERLINLAKRVESEFGGEIPNDYDTLLSLKGVGPYIASAILIFAYNEKRVVVDTNVIKVLEAELGIKSIAARPRTDKKLWEFAQTLAPNSNVKEFNWALLDYVALVL